MDNKEEILAGIIDRKFESRLEMVLLKKGIEPVILSEVIEESIFDDEEEHFMFLQSTIMQKITLCI